MVIKEISPGQKAPCGNEGALIFVGAGENTVVIDVQARQSDKEEIVDISQDEHGNLLEGKGPWYVATVIIPPRHYQLVDTGKVNEKEQPIIEKETLPVDMDSVTVVLWPINKPLNNEGGKE